MRRALLVLVLTLALCVRSAGASADTGGMIVSGSVPPNGGFGLIVWGGGTYDQLITAAQCPGSPAFWATDVNGNFIVFVPAATVGAVNSGFATAFPNHTIPPNTPLIGRCLDSPTTRTVTLNDNGSTIYLHVNDTFLLMLGDGYNWNPQVADQSIVSRVPNVAVVRGAQGIYRAHLIGQTSLTATGDPPCRSSTPPCGVASLLFSVSIVVQ